MAVISKDLGPVTAYAAAVNRGYTGTREEFETLMASYATVAERAGESASQAAGSASDAESSASQAAASASDASGSASQAAQSAGNASRSATAACIAQTAAESARDAAQVAQTAAETAQAGAEAAVDGFDSAVTRAIFDVNTAGTNQKELAKRQAEKSEAWAVGQINGEDVGVSDPAYHNNAKYYAGQASVEKTAAQQARQGAETAESNASASATSAAASAADAAASAQTLVIDDTLTQAGQVADAKVVGDEIRQIKEDFTDISETVNGVIDANYTEGKNITRTGEIVDDENSSLSELIPVTWTWDSTTYNRFYFNKAESDPNYEYTIVFYDANQTVIGYKGSYGTEYRAVTGYDDVAYVRFSFRKGTTGKLTNYANPPTVTYWTISEVIAQNGLAQNVGDLDGLATTDKSSLVGAVNELKGEIPALPITPKDTDFFHVGKNMIDPSKCVSGEFVNQVTGAFVTNSAYNRTDYIVVEPLTEYVVRRDVGGLGENFRYVFYDSNKGYLSGAVGALPDMLLTSPANAKYIVISHTSAMSTTMIAPYINGDKSYEAYGNEYILNEYIKPDMEDVLLTIPSKIYALVGYELNIYFENITEEWEKYKWDVTCSKGMQFERGYRFTPVAGDIGTYTLTIKASLSDAISKEVTTTLVVTSASAGASVIKSVIVLGDSTTNSGIAITKLNENFSTDVMGISTLGTRGTSPNNHEGRSGWKLKDYFTKEYIDYTDGRGRVENPFYNSTTQTFDADYYFANSEIAKPDWFFINMGINDVFSYETGTALDSAIETCIGYVDSMIASVKSASPSSKIGVCLTIPPNHSQDAFGKAYSNGQTRHRYKKNNTIWVNRLIAEYDSRESEGIYLIPIHTNLDTVYNMGMETLPVNARNTTITYQSPIANGGVHPVESGYWQIADVYTAFLKAYAED